MSKGFIPAHGGYKKLLSYEKAEIVYDATVRFCNRFIDKRSRTHDQISANVIIGLIRVTNTCWTGNSGTWNKPSSQKAGCASA